MAFLPEDLALWALLVAPGFLAVVFAFNLASIETVPSDLQLLIWSLISSIIVDTSFVAVIQPRLTEPITSQSDISAIFFTPNFRADYVILLIILAGILGFVYSVILINEYPRSIREKLQVHKDIRSHPVQPWESFLREAGAIRIKTSDNELYSGLLNRWSTSNKPNELVITHPYRYNSDSEEYEEVGGKAILFLGEDIDRILVQKTRSEIVDLQNGD